MRFGPFVLQISPDPSLDSQIIDSTLKEAELADALGYDVIWLTEHYFGGDTVYADPVVFGAAVAAVTHRIKIGFAVVQMAFHHPSKAGGPNGVSWTTLATDASLWARVEARHTTLTSTWDLAPPWKRGGGGWTRPKTFFSNPGPQIIWTIRASIGRLPFPIMRPKPYQQPHPPSNSGLH